MTQLLLAAAALYALAVGGLYLAQERLIFPRSLVRAGTDLPSAAERLTLTTADGHRLVGALVRATGPSRGLIIGFGGNAWHGDAFASFLAERLPDVDLVVFHYRGYPPSEGAPSEAALFEDAILIHDRLVARLRPARVVLAGFSIGSGVAAYLASRRPVAGLLLVTPFDSLAALAARRYAWVPVRALLRHPFRSDEHLAGLDIPAAVIIASDDRIVPRERSLALVQALRRPVLVETVTGSHNGIYADTAIDLALRRALDALLPAP
jgi:pimeloyl-ACP methyl ester carboxylesterase